MVKQSPITEDFMATPVCVFTHVYLNFEFVFINNIFNFFTTCSIYFLFAHFYFESIFRFSAITENTKKSKTIPRWRIFITPFDVM